MNAGRKIYDLIRLLSLDVALGALGGGLFASRVLDVGMPWTWFVCLPVSVWLIYTLDHLLDAHRLKESASTPRHIFHFEKMRILSVCWLLLAFLNGFLVIAYLPSEAILTGLALSAFVIIHLLIVKLVGNRTSPFLVKEAGVAGIYAAGVWGIPWALHEGATDFHAWLAFGVFFMLALVNLLLFSLYEAETDQKDGQTSFVLAIGVPGTKLLIRILMFFSLAGSIALIFFSWWVGAILLIMWMILGLLVFFPEWAAQYERYRAIGDGAFILPYLVLLV